MGNKNQKAQAQANPPSQLETTIKEKYLQLQSLKDQEQKLNAVPSETYSNELHKCQKEQIEIRKAILVLEQKKFTNDMETICKIQSYQQRINAFRRVITQLEKRESKLERRIDELNETLQNKSQPNDETPGYTHALNVQKCNEDELSMLQQQKYEYELKVMEAEDGHLNAETLKAIDHSNAVLDDVKSDEIAEMQLNAEFDRASTAQMDKYNNSVNDITNDVNVTRNAAQQRFDSIETETMKATNEVIAMNQEIKKMRATEEVLLQRYQMYKYAAKNMKDIGDKVSALSYLRQSKAIAKQIEDVRNNKVVLVYDVPPALEQHIWSVRVRTKDDL